MQTQKLREYEDTRSFQTFPSAKVDVNSALNLRLLSEEHDLHIIASLLCKTLAYDVPELAMI